MIPDKIYLNKETEKKRLGCSFYQVCTEPEGVEYIRKDSIKAKPLEWEYIEVHEAYEANYKGTFYKVMFDDSAGLWKWLDVNSGNQGYIRMKVPQKEQAIKKAKAAAQEHYDNFIKSQIL